MVPTTSKKFCNGFWEWVCSSRSRSEHIASRSDISHCRRQYIASASADISPRRKALPVILSGVTKSRSRTRRATEGRDLCRQPLAVLVLQFQPHRGSSFISGFLLFISSSFFDLFQPFSCFSRAIAYSGLLNASQYIKISTLYFDVKPSVFLFLCSFIRLFRLPVTPMYSTVLCLLVNMYT